LETKENPNFCVSIFEGIIEIKGVFACRSPSRPNPIAFCVVKLLKKKGNSLIVRGLDALDKTPLIDIKPYFSDIDSHPEKD